MLHSMELENFKAFGKRVHIPFAPITLIFGQNSAGKSSILQALHLMKQTYDSSNTPGGLTLRGAGCIVDFGTFREVVHDHNLDQEMSVKLAARSSYNFDSDDELQHINKPMAVEWFYGCSKPDTSSRLRRVSLFLRDLDSPFTSFDVPDDIGRFIHIPSTDTIGLRAHCTGLSTDPRHWEQYVSCVVQDKSAIRKILRRNLALARKEKKETMYFPDVGYMYKSKAIRTLARALTIFSTRRLSNEAIVKWLSSLAKGLTVGITRLFPDVRLFFEEPHRLWFLLQVTGLSGASEPFYTDWVPDNWIPDSRRVGPAFPLGYGMGPEYEVLNVLSNLLPIGPLRKPPERWYLLEDIAPTDVGFQGEQLPNLLHRNRELLEETNKWLKKLDVGYTIKLRHIDKGLRNLLEIRLQDTRRRAKPSVALADVGFGVSQVLPMVVESLNKSERIITIEQPEVHIHPRLQADLGDLFIHSVRKGSYNQLIIETHSEHLILRLLRRIRETTNGTLPEGVDPLRPKDLSVLYVKRGSEGSEVIRLPVTPDGDFETDWPDGFFSEREKELF